jgi:hypothetical protein
MIQLSLLWYLLEYELAHPINAVVHNKLVPKGVGLQQKITHCLLMNPILQKPLAVTLEHYPSDAIFLQAILFLILCHWCAVSSPRAVDCWMPSYYYGTDPILCNPLPWFDIDGLSNLTINAIINNHDPSQIMDFY